MYVCLLVCTCVYSCIYTCVHVYLCVLMHVCVWIPFLLHANWVSSPLTICFGDMDPLNLQVDRLFRLVSRLQLQIVPHCSCFPKVLRIQTQGPMLVYKTLYFVSWDISQASNEALFQRSLSDWESYFSVVGPYSKLLMYHFCDDQWKSVSFYFLYFLYPVTDRKRKLILSKNLFLSSVIMPDLLPTIPFWGVLVWGSGNSRTDRPMR